MRVLDYEVKSIEDSIDYTIPQSILLTNVKEMWDKGYFGNDIHIAVIDTGCDKNHYCINDRIVETKNFINNSNDVTDKVGHGTHVAGIIAANRSPKGITGIAPESKLHIYKVLDKNSGGIEPIINAINYASEQNIDIINLSLGTNTYNEELKKAIDRVISKGISVVSASGNEAKGDNGSVDEICYPAYFREVIEVGSINKDNNMSSFSNSNENMDLATYGGSILSLYPNNKFATTSGTSMATPLVSGALALLKQKFKAEFGRNPECESELYAQLIKNTKTLPDVSRKLQGNGILYFIEE